MGKAKGIIGAIGLTGVVLGGLYLSPVYPTLAHQLGEKYATPEKGNPDFQEAMKWYRVAAERGIADAQFKLGGLYYFGYGTPQDYTEAAKWYQKAAEQGDVQALHNLAVSYFKGQGVPQDYAKAIKMARADAEAGDANSQLLLGKIFAFGGHGVAQDYAEGAKWYRKAADQGNANAEMRLGVLYEQGEGVPLDAVEASKWYRKASDQGNALAQSQLALLYAKGQGVQYDAVEAYVWFCIAAADGDKNDIEARDQYEIAAHLSSEQIEAAQRRAGAWIRHATVPSVSGSAPKQPTQEPASNAKGTGGAESPVPVIPLQDMSPAQRKIELEKLNKASDEEENSNPDD